MQEPTPAWRERPAARHRRTRLALVDLTPDQVRAIGVVASALADSGLSIEQPAPNAFVVALPGEHKLSTPCAFVVGTHTLSVNAFVARRPDENHDEVYRRLLQRNTLLSGVAFALDRLGDIYLVGRIATEAVTEQQIDALLGSVTEAADSMFDRILATGFASSIRKEWEWRQRQGQPLENLEPFRALLHLDLDDQAPPE
jgi:hypothetical protein